MVQSGDITGHGLRQMLAATVTTAHAAVLFGCLQVFALLQALTPSLLSDEKAHVNIASSLHT
jgi:hypothetical protein